MRCRPFVASVLAIVDLLTERGAELKKNAQDPFFLKPPVHMALAGGTAGLVFRQKKNHSLKADDASCASLASNGYRLIKPRLDRDSPLDNPGPVANEGLLIPPVHPSWSVTSVTTTLAKSLCKSTIKSLLAQLRTRLVTCHINLANQIEIECNGNGR